uniref:Uncharacterized protein n=1 Tax=Onchocerca volvulus TaxID=6282 RepID=A0A8R1TQ30_ONCVO
MSGDKKRPRKKQVSTSSNEEDDERTGSFMSKLCARFERMRRLPRVLEQSEEESEENSKSRPTSPSSLEFYTNVHHLFCDQPSKSKEKSSTSKDQPSTSKDQPSKSKDQPSTRKDQSSRSKNQPSISKDQSLKSKDQPSVSKESKPKSDSKKKQFETEPSDSNTSKIKPSESSKRTDRKTEELPIEKSEAFELGKQIGAILAKIPAMKLSTPAPSPKFTEQPFIVDPDVPSTSSEFREINIDDKIVTKASRSKFSQEGTKEGQSNVAATDDTTNIDLKDYLKRPNLRTIQKKTRLGNRPEKVSAVESMARKGAHSTMKQTKSEKTTTSASSASSASSSKTDVKHEDSAEITRLLLQLNAAVQNKMAAEEASKSDRTQHARERLRRKFKEGQKKQKSSPSKKKGRDGNE